VKQTHKFRWMQSLQGQPWTATVKGAYSRAEEWSIWDLNLIQISNTILNMIIYSLGA